MTLEMPAASEARQTSAEHAERIYRQRFTDLWHRSRKAIEDATHRGYTMVDVPLKSEPHERKATNRAAREIQRRLSALGYAVSVNEEDLVFKGWLRIGWSER